MSNMYFSEPEGFYEHFAKFSVQSPTTVVYEGEEYVIHHTQFASYNVQELFETIVQETEDSPLDTDGDFPNQAEEAVEESDAYLDRDMEHYYENREYVKPTDFNNACFDYKMSLLKSESEVFTPKAESRVEAIAEVITLYHAGQAGLSSFVLTNEEVMYRNDEESETDPDPGVVPAEYSFAIKDIVEKEGHSCLSRPDPSVRAIREIFKIIQEVGIKPEVRDVYAFFVEPVDADFYRPFDSEERSLLGALDPFSNSNPSEKWTSNQEPPLSTLKDD